MRHMTGVDGLSSDPDMIGESALKAGGSGWFAGHAKLYDREFAVDVEQLFAFLKTTQPDETLMLGIVDFKDWKNIARQEFLARLQGEISRRGTIDVLRNGIKHGALSFDLFYGTPSPENKKAVERHAQNRFSITRQLAKFLKDGKDRRLYHRGDQSQPASRIRGGSLSPGSVLSPERVSDGTAAAADEELRSLEAANIRAAMSICQGIAFDVF